MWFRWSLLLALSTVATVAQQFPALPPAPYQELYRPYFHFSPQQNWTNDPCGLVHYNNEYHLFFQYNPEGDTWGHMSWGHAISPNLVEWKELPVAIPERGNTMIFTGSSVVDARNTSGLCPDGKCIVSIYTGHTRRDEKTTIQTQNLAASDAAGRRWMTYSGNPVLDLGMKDFRDPKVFWHAVTNRWIMVVALPTERKVRFYHSSNLKEWNALSDFGPAGAPEGIWECPELFELPVEGLSAETRWVLKIGLGSGHLQGGSGEQYFVGTFDGSTFRPDQETPPTLWADYGKDCYCALVFNHAPAGVNLIGWMNNWQYAAKVPTKPWRGQMTLPRQLALRQFPEGIRLVQAPVAALRQLRGEGKQFTGSNAAALNKQIAAAGLPGPAYELHTTIRMGSAVEAGWKLMTGAGREAVLGYDATRQELFFDRRNSGVVGFSSDFPGRYAVPLPLEKGEVGVHIFVDRSSVEVFAGSGRVVLTNLVYPFAGNEGLEFYSKGGARGTSVTAQIWPLRSIWPKPVPEPSTATPLARQP